MGDIVHIKPHHGHMISSKGNAVASHTETVPSLDWSALGGNGNSCTNSLMNLLSSGIALNRQLYNGCSFTESNAK